MDVSAATEILAEARRRDAAGDWFGANLAVAAALTAVFEQRPIIVGGSAETFWTRPEVYHETDLDLWHPGLSDREESILDQLGFRRDGRHWVAEDLTVVIEFAAGRFAGDLQSAEAVDVLGQEIRVIALDDLFLDRLQQSTGKDIPSAEFDSVYALAVQRYDAIDWAHVRRQIKARAESSPIVGRLMAERERRLRRLLREALGP